MSVEPPAFEVSELLESPQLEVINHGIARMRAVRIV
jgi:hypothetical protein